MGGEEKNGSVTIKLPSKFVWFVVFYILGISTGGLGGFLGLKDHVSPLDVKQLEKLAKEIKCGND